ncbi:MAG: tetratricopeptide repeat protein [Candidatus Lernaella stagnicola]|nr:tetratricopeptide repeat protein [Candidatus Lernaella stagnicola]
MEPKRILVVEPAPEQRQAIEAIFDLRGDQVIFAKDEEEAFAIFKDIEFDLLLIEVLLPRGSGYSLTSRVRDAEQATGRHTPILLMGGVLRNFNMAHEARIKFGADNVLVKPFQSDDIRVKLAIHLDGIDPAKLETEADLRAELFGTKNTKKLPYVEPVRVSGCLNKVPFARVLGEFWRLGETGYLHCQSGTVAKTLHFNGGRLVFVSGGNRRETLGWLLVREGLLNTKQINVALDRMIDSGKKLGEVLLEQLTINPHDLFQKMQHEMEEKILHLFRWTDGRYWFEPMASIDSEDVVPLTINVGDLLRTGIGAIYDTPALMDAEFREWLNARVRKTIPDDTALRGLHPTRHEKLFWDAVNGETTLSKLLDGAEGERAELMRFLYLLVCLGAIHFVPAETRVEQPANIIRASSGNAHKQKIDERFQEICDVPPGEALGSGEGDFSERHKAACRGLLEGLFGSGSDPVTLIKAEAVFERLDEAYRTEAQLPLIVRRSRTRYENPTPREKVLEAELHFQKGIVAYREENFLQASDHFQIAIDRDENTADYHAYLGYTLFRQKDAQEESEPVQAIRHLNKALELDIHLPEAYLFLGYIHWELGQEKRAESYFEQALVYDPDNVEALQHLRLLFANRRAHDAAERGERSLPAQLIEHQKEIIAFFNFIQTGDYFDILGVSHTATAGEIKQAYFSLAGRIRSEKIHREADEITREQADEVFAFLTVAYSTLTHDARRREYLARLETQTTTGIQEEAGTADQARAEEAFQRGRRNLRRQELKNAVSHLRHAHDIMPGDPGFLAWLGFAKYRLAGYASTIDGFLAASGKDDIRRALILQPGHVDASVLLGKVYMREGKYRLAEEQFDNALLADRGNLDALKAYRRIHTRRKTKPAVPIHRRLNGDQDRLYVELSEAVDDSLARHYFDVLNISFDADREEIKTAYDVMCGRLLHSVDRQQAAPDVRFRIDEIRDRLERVFSVLNDDHLRECYLLAMRGDQSAAGAEEGDTPEGDDPSAGEGSPQKLGVQDSAFWDRVRRRFGKGTPKE